jgi:molecular chaperone GrpE
MKRKKDDLDDTQEKRHERAKNTQDDSQVKVRIVSGENEDVRQEKADNEGGAQVTDKADDSDVKEKAAETGAEAAKKEEDKEEEESDRYLRLAAEFDNYRKRTAREFGELITMANSRLLKELIEIKDNFERALEGEVQGDLEAYRKGVELIYNQLTELLQKENVEPIEAVGKPFDPNYHEAIMQQESDEYDEGIVAGEMQKGYRLGDRVLRHTRVIVSAGERNNQQDENANK